MSKFVDVEWFGREDEIGIVLTYDEFDGFKARMAPLPKAARFIPDPEDSLFWLRDEELDIKWLMENAAKIPFEWAWGIFHHQIGRYMDEHNVKVLRYDRQVYQVSFDVYAPKEKII